MSTFWIIVGIIAAIAVYWVPSVVASRRHVTNAGSVFVVNLFLGWSLIGWVVALAMAVRSATMPPEQRGPESFLHILANRGPGDDES